MAFGMHLVHTPFHSVTASHPYSRPGELTDCGRETTLALGTRLRKLYVDQLRFLPPSLGHQNEYYLRATPVERALESLQQVFVGLYPTPFRDLSALPIIHSRSPADENLFPNEANCRRFAQLTRAFAKAAAEKWNDSPEMEYLQQKIGKWMPGGEQVKVDSHPRLSGLFDSINTTLVHGPQTRLPDEFYEDEVRRILNDINVDEWFRGYKESTEFRRLGISSLLEDIKTRVVAVSKGESAIKLALMGCHDTTIVSESIIEYRWKILTEYHRLDCSPHSEVSTISGRHSLRRSQ